MERIPIAMLTRPMSGGMKKHILQLLKGISKNKYTVHLLGPENLAGELYEKVHYYPVLTNEHLNPFYKISQILELCRYLRKNNIKLLHCHGVQASLIGRLAAFMARVPAVICTFHNLVYDRSYTPWQKRIYASFNRFLNTKTNYIITVSEALKQHLIELEKVPVNKIRVIYNGLEKSSFTSTRLPDKQSPNHKPLIGIIGRLVPEKGVDLFLEAASHLLKVKPDTQIWIIGDGPERNTLLKQTEKLGLQTSVKFWGHVDDPKKLVQLLDVVVVPSRSEGLSIATLEAMALAKPVVAFEAGALPEVVIHETTGLLVPSFNVQVMAEAILRLLNNYSLRAVLGSNGYARAKTAFSAEKMIKETEAVYGEALTAFVNGVEG